MIKKLFFSLVLLQLSSIITPAAAATAKCELDRPIVFAGFNWDSANFHNSVARFIIEHGFNCKTEAISGATIPLFNGMARGNIDIAMEIWKQAVDKMWAEGLASGKYKEIGTNLTDAQQGVFVPKYLLTGKNAKAPKLKSVSDLKNYVQLFRDPEEPDKGRFYNCVIGWSCADINTKKLIAYGLKDLFVDVTPGAGHAITSAVESALRRKKPVVFYYWTPSWLIGKYQQDLVMLDEPEFNAAIFEKMQRDKVPTAATAYARTVLKIGVRAAFVDEAPQIAKFLGNYRTNSALVSQMLAYMQNNDQSAAQAAVYFLKQNPKIWKPWLDAATAARVASALQ